MKRHIPTLNLTYSGELLDTLEEARRQRDITFTAIRECEEIVQDCLHYLEFYSLPGGKQLKITKVLREALLRKRQMQDEHVLICAALGDIDNADKHRDHKETYAYHISRIDGGRTYRPRRVTLNQVLGIEEPPKPVSKKFERLSRFTSKGIKDESK